MKEIWFQATLTQDQFLRIDRWIYTFIQNSGKPDPLNFLDYFVLVKKPTSLHREVIFSPECFPLLCDLQPEFRSINTKVIPKPTHTEVRNLKQPFIFWFGNVNYLFNIYPAEIS